MSFYANYPFVGGPPIYPNLAAFPATAVTGALGVAADTGILYEFNGTMWVAITGTGAVTSVGALDGQAPSANGAVISGTSLFLQSASATFPGLVNTTTQSFAGNKTFTGTITASNLSGTNTGDVTLTAVGAVPNANGASLSGQALTLQPANGTFPGVLLAADFTTFNNKQPAGAYITALTGDGTATGPGSVTFTLATVNANVGSFGSSTAIPSFTVNAKGLITAASTNVVIAPAGTLTGTTLASNVVTSSLTSVGTIISGTWNGTTIAIANGGTGQTTASAAFGALSPLTTKGDLLTYSTLNTRLPVGTNGQLLSADSAQTTGLNWISSVPVTSGGTGTATAFTQGSVVFAGASGVYSQDNANFFWDDPNNRLGIGTSGPVVPLNVVGGTDSTPVQFELSRTAGGVGASPALILKNTDSTNGNKTGIDFKDHLGGISASIEAVHTTHSATAPVGALLFATTNGSATPTEKMRINATGLQIGTTGVTITSILSGSATSAFGTVSANAVATLDVTVTGAVLGNGVFVGADPAMYAGTTNNVSLYGAVQAAGNVRVYFLNHSASSITTVNKTVTVYVFQ